MSTPALLVIHPPSSTRDLLLDAAARAGFAVHVSDTGAEGLSAFRQRPPDAAIVSLDQADIDGLGLLTSLREEAPDLSLMLVTACASVESAVAAIRLGVHQYLREPIDVDKVRRLLADQYDDALRRRVRLFPAERSPGVTFHGMIGRSVPMQKLFRVLRTVAPHVRTALVSGETGTGKELVARALHQLGPRADRRFVVINCSAVVETLFESELFGHVRGAFPGATDSKPGLFELADGGTLFLDEVAELPAGVQARLLRTIEFGEVHRVGSLEPRKVDVTVIAATNRDLEGECDAGRFRRDLFYRLNVVDIHVPPLRDRRDDIVYLANAFMRATATRLAKPLSGLTSGAERLLREADWYGNVRELRNVLERACLMAEGRLVGELDVKGSLPPPRTSPPVHAWPVAPIPPAAGRVSPAPDAVGPLSDVEREHIMRALQRADGNKKKAATLLGLSRRALYRKLERLDLGVTIARRGKGAA
ncbi:sigma-54 dependent transcriptional regulator [Luteitalea sp. TBR-22]|uniref:sigma-54-dependent transcriptional regulator n=1 Tax=Luteitalea sp. TBR-22 TaxID=2802971 RepID=UPI001EF5AB26|nr:sigma-54 dependent transcriptional regulator [Luteitalea sp. TBR-22]